MGYMGFKSGVDQISHTLPAIRYRCKFEVWAQAQAVEMGTDQLVTRLMTAERVLSEYNEDVIFLNYLKCYLFLNALDCDHRFYQPKT